MFQVEDTILIPITIGLVEVIKREFKPNKKLVPLISLVVAVCLSLFFNGLSKQAFAYGVFIGLSASGLYSGVKTQIKNGGEFE